MMNSRGSKYAIVDGLVVDPANKRLCQSNIFIDNGLISEVSAKRPPQGLPVIEVKGKIVAPGFIDLHVHLREPGFEYKEDIESGGKAAAAGGFTSIFCMPNTDPVNDNISITKMILERARKSSPVKVYPVGAISVGLKGEELADIEGMARAGVIAISDDGSSVQNEGLMKRAMELTRSLDLLVISHPEDFAISKDGVINDGTVAWKLGLKGIPNEAEDNIIKRDIDLARTTGARLHIAHLSTAGGLDLVRRAKEEGLRVTCEVTPHHISLTDQAVSDLDPNAKMKPPLRTEADRQALIKGIQNGVVDAIATDHAPHAGHEKEDFANAAFGAIGLETALPICLKLVHDKVINIGRLIELLTAGPARLAGLKTDALNEGSPANITIVDPDILYKIDSKGFYSKSHNTPFDGWDVKGKVLYTIANGKVVYQTNG